MNKLSADETAIATAEANEDWSNWDATVGDGLEDLPWENEIPIVE